MKLTTKKTALALGLVASQAAVAATTLEEVIVTAQFKEQSLQDASVAVDAFTGDQLRDQGINSAEGLSQLVPALTITAGGGIASSLYMRGIGNSARNNYLDPAIILNYDGVPIARGSATSIAGFFDLNRVEVLKGPQGTLYGKNATGGVLNLNPAKPVIGENSGFISGAFGNYSASEFTGAINVALGDNSALRVSAALYDRDGYSSDGTNDDDRTSIRVQYLTQVNDRLTIRLSADSTDIGGVGGNPDIVGRYSPQFDLILDGNAPGTGMLSDEANDYRTTVLSAPGFGFLQPITDQWRTDAKLSGYHAEIIYETDAGVLTVIPAYREQEQDSLFGGPGFASGWWDNSAEQTTLEVRFQGESDTVDYLVGAFYFEEDTKGDNTFNQEFVLPLQDYTMSSDSWAAFAELTWKLSDTSRLITGARYTDDSRDIDGKIENFIVFCGGIPPTTPPASFGLGCAVPGNLPHFPTFDTPAQAEAYLVDNGYVASAAIGPPNPLTSGTGVVLHSFASNQQSYASDEVTWRVVYEQDILSDSLFYASFATGYRAGGLEPTGNTFDPEYLDAYTIGLKNRFLDGSLQLNLELFRWEYTDQQISYFRVVGQTLENTADNVGQATNQGLDIDLLWAASDSTLIRSKVQLLDNSYDDLHFSTSPPRHNINCPSTVVGSLPSGAPIFDFNCSGNQSIYSPDVTLQFGIEHTIDMSGYNVVLGVDTTYVDDQVTGFQNLAHEVIESHWMTNADITLASQSAPWSVTAYARNLEDERRALSSQTPLLGMAIVRHGPDMTYGVRFNYEF